MLPLSLAVRLAVRNATHAHTVAATPAALTTLRSAAAAGRLLHTSTKLATAKNPADTHGLSHWRAERLVSVALVPIIGAAFIVPGTAVDMALAVSVPVHNWMGMEAVLVDYWPRGSLSFAKGMNAVIHAATVGGLIYFSLNDVGICEGMKLLWAL